MCPECGHTDEVVRSMSQSETLLECSNCTAEMTRDYQSERTNIGDKEYGRQIVSDTLAMNPSQIPEHQERFPDIKVLPDGRPVFDSYRSHDRYLKQIGAVKNPQRIRRRGKRLVKTTRRGK